MPQYQYTGIGANGKPMTGTIARPTDAAADAVARRSHAIRTSHSATNTTAPTGRTRTDAPNNRPAARSPSGASRRAMSMARS